MKTFGQVKNLVCASLIAFGIAVPAMAVPIIYMTGTGNPWDVSATNQGSNETAMNTAFGAGNWSKVQGFSMAAFASDTTFLYLDGSDSQATQFNSFISGNLVGLTSYVSKGGTLILNAAPNQGGSFSMGFGATLNYNGGNTGSGNVSATSAGVASGIFDGIGTNFTGSGFTHGFITGGADYVSLLNDDANRSAFGVQKVGAGTVGFGGMTLPYFHGPAADSRQLLANMMGFVSAQAQVSEVPEPGSMLLIGLGLAGAAFARRRKV